MAKKTTEPPTTFEDIDGSELLAPICEMTGANQLRLLAKARQLGLDSEDREDVNLDAVADLIDYVAERYAKQQEAFDKFTSGEGGFSRAMTLVMAYIGEVGKGVA